MCIGVYLRSKVAAVLILRHESDVHAVFLTEANPEDVL